MGIEELLQRLLSNVDPRILVQFLQVWDQLRPEEKDQVLGAIAGLAQQGQPQRRPQRRPVGSQQGPRDGSGPSGSAQVQREQNLYG